MSFKDKSFNSRFAAMGDQSEQVFEAVYDQGFVRWGLNRPPINLKNVPPFVRYAPDYLTGKGFVEVQGFGTDQKFKLKDDKADALVSWNHLFRTDIFVFDSKNSRYGWLRLNELLDVLDEDGTTGAFDAGRNPYRWLSAEELPVVDEWHEYVES